MSGCSYTTKCPNCGKNAEGYTDWKPFDSTSIYCNYCGLEVFPTIRYSNLEELNDNRHQVGLKPLKKLPKQIFGI